MGHLIKYKLINKIENTLRIHVFSDETYIRAVYYLSIGKELNLEEPLRFTEKLQWLKLRDNNEIYSCITDKYEVKKYFAETIGANHVIPTIGLWKSPEDIDWELLPDRFVLKCTHDSGSIIICKNKETFNYEKAKTDLKKSLKINWYFAGREPNYKNIHPRIIAEPFLTDPYGELLDYKFFCFHGKVKFFKIDFNRFRNHQANYYDKECNLLPFGELSYPQNENLHIRYANKINEMIEFAEIISRNLSFVRVDFYCTGNDIFVGEMTLYPGSGFIRYNPDKWDYIIGELLTIPQSRLGSLD